jgi:hypothetical protein
VGLCDASAVLSLLEADAGVLICHLGLTSAVREPCRVHGDPAAHLDVALLAGDLAAPLQEAAFLLQLAQADQAQPLEPDTEGVGADHAAETGSNGQVAARQLERAVADGDRLAVLAAAEDVVGGGRACDVQRSVAGFVGQGDRPPAEPRGLAPVAVAGTEA